MDKKQVPGSFEIVTQHELQMWVTEPQALAYTKKARNDNMKERRIGEHYCSF